MFSLYNLSILAFAFSYQTLNILLQFLLAYIVSDEVSDVILVFVFYREDVFSLGIISIFLKV